MTIRSIMVAGIAALCIGFTMPAAFATPGNVSGAIVSDHSEIKSAKSSNADEQRHAGLWDILTEFLCYGVGGTYVSPYYRNYNDVLTPRPGGGGCY